MKLSERVREAARFVEDLIPEAHAHNETFGQVSQEAFRPHTVIILGSGMGFLAGSIDAIVEVSFEDIPWCNLAGAPGHLGTLILGTWASEQVICLNGRLHTYEGNTPLESVFPLLVAHTLGARRLITTNAAGAINTDFEVGDLMLINDHINFTAASPLTFDDDNDLTGLSFDMTHAYTPALCELARAVAREQSLPLREGVYLGLRGPMFETPAEIRMFHCWGADAVGMSTVHEVIMASALGMEVCGISLLTNMAAGILDIPITADEVFETAHAKGMHMGQLIQGMLQ